MAALREGILQETSAAAHEEGLMIAEIKDLEDEAQASCTAWVLNCHTGSNANVTST